jgi:hypothetical protein
VGALTALAVCRAIKDFHASVRVVKTRLPLLQLTPFDGMNSCFLTVRRCRVLLLLRGLKDMLTSCLFPFVLVGCIYFCGAAFLRDLDV